MFIAVINENFNVAEGQKRQQQIEMYLKKAEGKDQSATAGLLNKLSPYRYLRDRNAAILAGAATSSTQDQEKVDEKGRRRMSVTLQNIVNPSRFQRFLDTTKRVLRLDNPEEEVPLDTLRARQFRQSLSGEASLGPNARQSRGANGTLFDEHLFHRQRQLHRMRTDLGLGGREPLTQAQVDANYQQRVENDPRVQQAILINTHPSYDKTLWIFDNRSRLRRFCQSLVPPSYGERIFGRPYSRLRYLLFQVSIFLAIAASVVIAGVATPAYRREWYGENGLRRDSWFSVTEISLSIFFISELAIKVIADGFAFTPNAYLLNIWNALDLFVLGTLVINVTTEIAVIGGVSRFTRALKAFRALRLINLSSYMRNTFHAVVIAGAGRIADAAILAILYIVPYAVWGQNLFAGLLYSCNDGDGIANKFECQGEYSASPLEWAFLAPRVWANPTDGSVYSFDDFKSSLLILFEIVSLEGWIDVMTAAMSITGRNQQLEPDNRQVNALFFLIYNLIGAVFVLTLFVSVIIENFQTFSGAAYQTTEQRQWLDLKRLIARQKPSKRPKVKPADRVRAWCYDRAVHKHGWWSRGMTLLYILNIVTLMTQQYDDPFSVDQLRGQSEQFGFRSIDEDDLTFSLFFSPLPPFFQTSFIYVLRSSTLSIWLSGSLVLVGGVSERIPGTSTIWPSSLDC